MIPEAIFVFLFGMLIGFAIGFLYAAHLAIRDLKMLSDLIRRSKHSSS